MPTDRTALLAVGAGVGSFVIGRLLSGGQGTETVPTSSAAAATSSTPPVDSAAASLDFGDYGLGPGVLQGIDQGSGSGSGGLPGGGASTPPPPPGAPPPATNPTPTPAPAPTPAPTYPYPASLGPKPLTATGYISVHGGAFFRVIPGGGRTSYSGRYFSAWVSGPMLIRWSGGTASVYKVLSGAYIGWYIGVATSVTFRKV